MKKLTLPLAAAVFFTAVVVFAENGEENLLPIVPRQFASWVKFTEQAFDIPAGLLVKGRNEIRFKNTTPDAEASEDGITGDAFIAKRNYFWGWYQLSQIRFPQ